MSEVMKKLDSVDIIRFNWKFKSKQEVERVNSSKEVRMLIDEINTKRQEVKYANSSRISQLYIDFKCALKKVVNY